MPTSAMPRRRTDDLDFPVQPPEAKIKSTLINILAEALLRSLG
jgi:hypothetical protein